MDPGPEFRGRSLVPLLRRSNRLSLPPVAGEFIEPYDRTARTLTWRTEQWSYIENYSNANGDWKLYSRELYDARKDPDELHNIWAERDGVSRRLNKDMRQYFDSLASRPRLSSVSPPIPDETLKQLRTLGYVQ